MTEPMNSPWQELAAVVARRRPLIHAMQNLVTTQWVAAGLLAAGASPIVALDGAEAGPVAGRADALVLNLGTWSPEQQAAMGKAGAAAAVRKIPIILDPVGAGFLPNRTRAALELLDRLPVTVVRGNLGEVLALTGREGQVRGVDSTAQATDEAARRELVAGAAARLGRVVACTGATDWVAAPDGRVAAIRGGHPLLATVTGSGCLASALVAAVAAVIPDPYTAATAALQWQKAAGEAAGREAAGPGSFAPALLDALYRLRLPL